MEKHVSLRGLVNCGEGKNIMVTTWTWPLTVLNPTATLMTAFRGRTQTFCLVNPAFLHHDSRTPFGLLKFYLESRTRSASTPFLMLVTKSCKFHGSYSQRLADKKGLKLCALPQPLCDGHGRPSAWCSAAGEGASSSDG